MSLNESTVEEAALSWFDELGYGIGHGPEIAPGEPAAKSLDLESKIRWGWLGTITLAGVESGFG